MGSVLTPPPAPRGEGGCLAEDLGWLLAKASHALTSEVGRGLREIGLSPRGYHVLAAASAGEHAQSELADLVGVDKTTMVAAVDELEAAGLAERRPSPRDRRARIVAVTPAGAAKVLEGRERVAAIQADVLASLSPDASAGLLRTLGALVERRLSEPHPCEGLRRPRERR